MTEADVPPGFGAADRPLQTVDRRLLGRAEQRRRDRAHDAQAIEHIDELITLRRRVRQVVAGESLVRIAEARLDLREWAVQVRGQMFPLSGASAVSRDERFGALTVRILLADGMVHEQRFGRSDAAVARDFVERLNERSALSPTADRDYAAAVSQAMDRLNNHVANDRQLADAEFRAGRDGGRAPHLFAVADALGLADPELIAASIAHRPTPPSGWPTA